jgi:hypothetical protein
MRLTTPRIYSYAYPFDKSAGSKVPIMRADASGSAFIAGANGRLVVNGQTAPATPVAARKTASIANFDLWEHICPWRGKYIICIKWFYRAFM